MRKLILVKHAKPEVVDGVASPDWRLSEEGRRSAGILAERLRPYGPGIICTSDEPKAMETGQIVAEALGKPLETAPGLHEHDRSNVPMMPSREFISLMALFFKEHSRLVLGRETALDASARFAEAVDSVVAMHPEGNVVIVTHGTVLALFVGERAAGDPFQNWRRMALPSFAVFSVPEWRLLETVESLA